MPHSRTATIVELLLATGLAALACATGAPRSDTTLIANAMLLDGSGAPARLAAVRIRGGRIEAVGRLEATPGERVVDAQGRVLAPGFIDTHSHADDDRAAHPDALAAVSQGITRVVVGQDGAAPHPLRDFFAEIEREGSAVNVASYAGFGTLRTAVLGEDFRRPARADEIEQMRALLRAEMQAGALGLATGLEYDPDIYSSPEEVLALAREAAAQGGRYISHIRSEDRDFWNAVDEIIRIGREAGLPVQISHIKLALRSNHGKTQRLLAMLDEARASGVDITADLYPYTYWQSDLSVLFPARDFTDRKAASFALTEVTQPDQLTLVAYEPHPAYENKTLAEIAALRGSDPETALMDLTSRSQAYKQRTGSDEPDSIIAVSMTEPDIERLMQWPHTNLCTDGSLVASHPRGFGSYPRVLGRYVRERGVLDLATAVYKASGLAAAHMGFADRGLIRPGLRADLVLFDPTTVIDRATPAQPEALSVGIERVWVNGVVVYEEGRATGRRPGQVIRRQPSAAVHSSGAPPRGAPNS